MSKIPSPVQTAVVLGVLQIRLLLSLKGIRAESMMSKFSFPLESPPTFPSYLKGEGVGVPQLHVPNLPRKTET